VREIAVGDQEQATNNEQALWLLEKCVPGTGVNNIPFAFRVPGGLRRDHLLAALRHVADQHPALRTRFRVEDSRLVRSSGPVGDLVVEEITGPLPEFASRPFPLDGEPLLRAGIRSQADGDVVCVVAHHLVFDAISAFYLGEELASAYGAVAQGREPPRRAPGADRATTVRGDFWARRLEGFDPDQLTLGIGTRDTDTWTLAGAQVTHEPAPEVANVVARLRKQLRAPDGVVLLAAYYLLLARHGAGPDLVVGCPFTTRDETTAYAIGFHVNVVPLRVAVDPAASFRDLTRSVRGVFLDAMDHRTVEVEVPTDRPAAWRNPIFRHVFNYVPIGSDASFRFGDAQAETVSLDAVYSKFDLEFFLLASPDRLRLRAVYSTEVHAAADIADLLERYESLLLAVDVDVDRPLGELPSWGERATRAAEAMPALTVEADRELVERLVALWREVLARDDLDADANFFDNGGHSLLAAKLAQLAEGETGVPLTLAEFFANPTPRALACHLRGA
jgi:Condensation domain/Phosphopantetheine attachment site